MAARRPATHRVRLLAATAVIVLGCVSLAFAPSSAPPHQISKLIFVSETIMAFGFCLLSGVFLTADCLSVEKRDGTLGLLFLTDLSGFDIVLGKLAATSIQSAYGMLAIFPILGLPLLMGGVSSGEFARALLALMLTLVLSLAIGLMVSAAGRETRQTMGATFGILLFLTGLLPALAWLQHVYSGGGRVMGKWFLASPVGALILAFDQFYRTSQGAGMFQVSMGILSAFSVGALVFAGLYLPRAFREEKSYLLRSSVGQRMCFRAGGGLQGRRAKLELNPFYWLAARDRLARLMIWSAVALLGVLWLCFMGGGLKFGPRRGEEAVAISFLVAFGLHALFKAIVALEASRRLSEDRQSGALELLLATPLPPRIILRGQLLALREHFSRPLLVVLLVNATLFWLTGLPANPLNYGPEERLVFRTLFLGGALVLLLDFRALSWTGMFMAMRSKSHSRAVLSTVGRVLLPPWAGIFAFALFGMAGQGLSSGTVETFVLLWLGAGAINSLALAANARSWLLDEFRTLAASVRVEPLETSESGLWAWRTRLADPGVL